MADTSGQADIRGIDIQKLATGFAEEATIFKGLVTNTTTSAREIRWYQKTAGYLTATSPAVIANVSDGSQPFILEQSVTRNTSYVRKYFVESPVISDEDIRDNDPDILAMNIRDLTISVGYAIDSRIWDVATESRLGPTNINLVNCSGSWSTAGGADPISDIMNAKTKIRTYGYNPEGAALILSASGSKNLISWLINTKGSSIPSFAAQRVQDGAVMEILGLRVYVSQNVTNNYGLVGDMSRAITWKEFVPMTARNIDEVGIGTKIRVWSEGEALLTNPKALCLLSGCGTA